MSSEAPIPARTSVAPRDRAAGWALIGASILSVALMARHPSTGAHGIGEALAEIVDESRETKVVHGGLIALMFVLVFGFLGLCERIGPGLVRVRLAAIAYVVGNLSFLGAAAVSGFVVPGVAERYGTGSHGELTSAHGLLALCHLGNQSLAAIGTIATSAAIGLLSTRWVRQRGVLAAIGVLGILVGGAATAGILTGHLRLHVHGMGAVVLAQSVWSVAAGTLLLRGGIPPGDHGHSATSR
jgi:hypothetical protein